MAHDAVPSALSRDNGADFRRRALKALRQLEPVNEVERFYLEYVCTLVELADPDLLVVSLDLTLGTDLPRLFRPERADPPAQPSNLAA